MKKFIKNPWTLGIGTTVIGGVLLSFVLDWIKGVDWLSTLKVVAKFIADTIIFVLNFEIKVWWLLVAIALIVVGLIIFVKILDIKDKTNPIPFLSYTKDSVLEYTWEWEYRKTSNGKYTISNLHPVCSKCGMILKQGYTGYVMEMQCLRCNTSQRWEDHYRDDAQMLIEDNIKRNFPKHE